MTSIVYYDKNRKIRDRSGNVRAARRVLKDELQSELLALKGSSRASHHS